MKHTDPAWRRNMRLIAALLFAMLLVLSSGCAGGDNSASSKDLSAAEPTEVSEKEEAVMKMSINGVPLSVEWEDNESVSALSEIVRKSPLTVAMSMYGGFEQVGPIGQSLPSNDVQTVTQPGDIVLYSRDRIVVFFGSNTWAYTRLGRILGLDASELDRLLGSGDVELLLYFE